MRNIKFRAWVAEEEKMIKTFDGNYRILFDEEDEKIFCGGFMSNGDWDEPPMMQFTGMLDKNRDEIFEGDIIEDEQGRRMVVRHAEFEHEDDSGNITLYFGWNIAIADGKGAISYRKYKIIGNIYETPELIP